MLNACWRSTILPTRRPTILRPPFIDWSRRSTGFSRIHVFGMNKNEQLHSATRPHRKPADYRQDWRRGPARGERLSHAARGATPRRHPGQPGIGSFNPRSRTGSDVIGLPHMAPWLMFQSTLFPCGATRHGFGLWLDADVSIHAPRAGSDPVRAHCVLHTRPRFNPRPPHGERLSGLVGIVINSKFQSTLPARGATAKYGVKKIPLPHIWDF